MPNDQAIFYSIFHSVSAFCNAGITLFEHNMTAMSGNIYVLGILSALVFAGGIGFIVWYELAYSFKHMYLWLRNKACPLFTFSLHTKIALLTSLLLISLGTLCIWGIEHGNSLHHLGGFKGFVNALFLSISMRSAGFIVTDISTMAPATILVMMALMIIGASPGSTGSGIKTTNFALFCASVRSIISNRDAVEIDGRTIPNDQMQKVIAVMTIAISWVMLTTFLLLLLEPHLPFIKVFFEAISAFSTCGLTMGITPGLCLSSKVILMCGMIVGRIGMLTLVLSLRKHEQKHLYRYPEERVLLG
jgi:trk system potassium uptake protein TrkH